jgi:hypothetical protein
MTANNFFQKTMMDRPSYSDALQPLPEQKSRVLSPNVLKKQPKNSKAQTFMDKN